MKGFNKIRSIIVKKNFSIQFEDVCKNLFKKKFITSQINSKTNTLPLQELQMFDEMIEDKISSFPHQIDSLIMKEYEKTKRKDKDDNDNDNNGKLIN
jgi:hypothetical protein